VINMKNSMLLYLVLSITVWVAPAHGLPCIRQSNSI
jgi:hypothetical protein